MDVWKCISVMSGEEILKGPVFDKTGDLCKERREKQAISNYTKSTSKPSKSAWR